LGGLIINETGEIPERDSEIMIGNFQFVVLEVSSNKIDMVSLVVLDDV
jgi:putative hemolysin